MDCILIEKKIPNIPMEWIYVIWATDNSKKCFWQNEVHLFFSTCSKSFIFQNGPIKVTDIIIIHYLISINDNNESTSIVKDENNFEN